MDLKGIDLIVRLDFPTTKKNIFPLGLIEVEIR